MGVRVRDKYLDKQFPNTTSNGLTKRRLNEKTKRRMKDTSRDPEETIYGWNMR